MPNSRNAFSYTHHCLGLPLGGFRFPFLRVGSAAVSTGDGLLSFMSPFVGHVEGAVNDGLLHRLPVWLEIGGRSLTTAVACRL